MSKPLKIDYVSDVVCPWCAIGLHGLEIALDRLGQRADAEITFHPYELAPTMPRAGQVHLDYITGKLGISADQARAARAQIRQRAADVGFAINRDDTTRIYNTFDAHRLLAWAQETGRQLPLKEALMTAYFTELKNLGDPEVLVAAVEKAGLDGAEARAILESDRYADEVRAEEAEWRERGVRSVPTVIVNGHVIGGAHPPAEFERQLREILAEQT
jgi:predicted DsbA family dithiol-disulfide isomerase